jgi:purine-nucleoside phosphorylase
MNDEMNKLQEAKDFILKSYPNFPKLAVTLGSGLSDLSESLEVELSMPFKEIPHFPKSTVEGHKGNLIVGSYKGKKICLLQGRVHFYEGYSPSEVVFPTRLLKLLGVQSLVLTNASGSLNPSWGPGEIMLITDHINFTGYNPLVGPNLSDLGPRFNDMSEPYNKNLSEKLKSACLKAQINLHEGVYIGVSGPSYETPAEIKAFSILGASAVGMSTVPEAIAGNHCGLEIAGLACLTNFASGISPHPLSHDEVTEASLKAKPKLIKAFKEFFELY